MTILANLANFEHTEKKKKHSNLLVHSEQARRVQSNANRKRHLKQSLLEFSIYHCVTLFTLDRSVNVQT